MDALAREFTEKFSVDARNRRPEPEPEPVSRKSRRVSFDSTPQGGPGKVTEGESILLVEKPAPRRGRPPKAASASKSADSKPNEESEERKLKKKERQAERDAIERATLCRRIVKLQKLCEEAGVTETEFVDESPPNPAAALHELRAKKKELNSALARHNSGDYVEMANQAAKVLEVQSVSNPMFPLRLQGLSAAFSGNQRVQLALQELSIEYDDLFAAGPFMRAVGYTAVTVMMVHEQNRLLNSGSDNIREDIAAGAEDL